MIAPSLAAAQTAPEPTSVSEDTIALLSPVRHGAKNPLLRPGRQYRGIPIENWMLYPSIVAGATFDDNLVWSQTNRIAAAGFRLAPEIVALRAVGASKTTLFGSIDARLYPSIGRADTVSARAGVEQVWTPTHDLTFKGKLEYDRNALAIGSHFIVNNSVLSSIATPLVDDKLKGTVAAQKTFGRMFVGLSLEAAATGYHALETSTGWASQSYRDSRVETATVRIGGWVTPAIYAFGEASGNARDYTNANYRSKGYRAIAGVGSDRISLFRGELYAGFQQQFYENYLIGTGSSPVIGGQLYWYPTRWITLRAALDQTFTDSNLPTVANPGGYPSKVTSARLSAVFKPLKDFTATWRASYEHTTYLASNRRDNGWRTGIEAGYQLTHSIELLGAYEFSKVYSTDSYGGYSRNSLSLGMKYRY
ncbi:MAG: outer membrane beta-barrel protein [Rhodoblastus sp.]|nr:outer membrane beta-barrel protein [Rhodoblastus sp.]